MSSEIAIVGDRMLSAEHVRINEILHDYDPYLGLAWIPPENREPEDVFPFAIVHSPPGAPPYIVKRLRENEVDHRVLAEVFDRDGMHGSVFDRITAENAALEVLKAKKAADEMMENHQMAAWLIRQDRTVHHNGVRYD